MYLSEYGLDKLIECIVPRQVTVDLGDVTVPSSGYFSIWTQVNIALPDPKSQYEIIDVVIDNWKTNLNSSNQGSAFSVCPKYVISNTNTVIKELRVKVWYRRKIA